MHNPLYPCNLSVIAAIVDAGGITVPVLHCGCGRFCSLAWHHGAHIITTATEGLISKWIMSTKGPHFVITTMQDVR